VIENTDINEIIYVEKYNRDILEPKSTE